MLVVVHQDFLYRTCNPGANRMQVPSQVGVIRFLVAQRPDEVTSSEGRQRPGEDDGSENQRSLPPTLLASDIAIYRVLRTLGRGLCGNLSFFFFDRYIHR